jgi:hypothetical protein
MFDLKDKLRYRTGCKIGGRNAIIAFRTVLKPNKITA